MDVAQIAFLSFFLSDHDGNDDDHWMWCSESLSEVNPRSKDQELHTEASAVAEATTKILPSVIMGRKPLKQTCIRYLLIQLRKKVSLRIRSRFGQCPNIGA